MIMKADISPKRYKALPRLVHVLLLDFGAWLVGSGARYYLEETPTRPRDWDVMIPPERWLEAVRTISLREPEISVNAFGGLKITCDPVEKEVVSYDIWPGTLDTFLPGDNATQVAVRLNPYTVVKASS